MSRPLTAGERHMLDLIHRDKQADGWTTASRVVFEQCLKRVPSELIELREGDGYFARLTAEGEAVILAAGWLR